MSIFVCVHYLFIPTANIELFFSWAVKSKRLISVVNATIFIWIEFAFPLKQSWVGVVSKNFKPICHYLDIQILFCDFHLQVPFYIGSRLNLPLTNRCYFQCYSFFQFPYICIFPYFILKFHETFHSRILSYIIYDSGFS